MVKEKVIGVVYPLPSDIAEDMFIKKKTIYVKYIPYIPSGKTKTKIREGIKLFIYKSGSHKLVLGEAKITKIEYLGLNEVLNKYKNKMVTPLNELLSYTKNRENKPLLVLHLKNHKKYKNLLYMKKSLTMAGQYITNLNKDNIFIN